MTAAVPAIPKLRTRLRSTPTGQTVEVMSTHEVTCPHCGAVARVKASQSGADLLGACVHVDAIEREGERIAVRFQSFVPPAAALKRLARKPWKAG